MIVNMKNILIYLAIVICIIGGCFLYWYFSLYLFEKDLEEHGDEYKVTVDQENEKNFDKDQSTTEQLNITASKDKRIMLADMLNVDNEILITEDNVDNTNKIIEKANLHKGIFVVESSREKFLEIVNTATENMYSINDEGYLVKPINQTKASDLTQKLNDYIDSENTTVINISNTYKGLLNDNMLLDFMIERTLYVQTFDYNDNIKIVLINPDRINEKSEDITQKEIYEEVLIGM